MLAADGEGAPAETGTTGARDSNGGDPAVLSLISPSERLPLTKAAEMTHVYAWLIVWLSCFQTEGESGAAASTTKKNFIDQYFGVEFETTYPCRLPSCSVSHKSVFKRTSQSFQKNIYLW